VVDLQPKSIPFVARDTFFVNIISAQILKGSVSITDASGSVVDSSRYEVDLLNGRLRGTSAGSMPNGETFTASLVIKPIAASTSTQSEDNNPVFDGIKVFVQDNPTGLDPLSIDGGRSGFKSIATNTNFGDETTQIRLAQVGLPAPFPSDFEIRFADYDTTANGNLINPADSSILSFVKTNFKIIDTETGNRIDFFISEPNQALRNGRWDWQEAITLLKPEAPQPTLTTYEVKFSPPSDTLVSSTGEMDSVVYEPPVYPGSGDVFLVFSTKPFEVGDKYSFTTRAATFNDIKEARDALKNVIVVPNPYKAYSAGEIAGVRVGERDDRRIEFRGLPPKCTIRIYTIVGELVDTIEKDDNRDFATWDLLTFEAQEISYGVYIYHVDAPGIGTKIGRFGVIK